MINKERRGTGEQAAALRREAQILRALERPGLPVVVALSEEEGETILTTAVPPGVPARDRTPLRPAEAAGVVLALAAMATDLHRAGVTRAPFSTDQVHLADGTRPVLVHLAGASTVGSPPPVGPADLGRILLTLLGPPRSRRLPRGDGGATALRRLAHRASDPEMTLEQFTAAIRAAAPGAHLPAASTGSVPSGHRIAGSLRSRRRHPKARTLAVIAVAVLALAGLSVGLVTSPHPPPRRWAPPAPSTTTTGVEAQDDITAVWPPYGCPEADAGLPRAGAPWGEDPCPQPVRVDGTTVAVGSRRWSVGGPGRYVLTAGDWGCTGTLEVAALDVETGEVWSFPEPPPAAREAVAVFVGRAEGAVGLAAPAGGCGPARPVSADGSPLVLDPSGPVDR